MNKTFVFLLLGAGIFAGLLPLSNTYGQGNDTGRALYEEKCVICHGAKGKGDGPAAAALSPPPKDFNSPEFWKQKNVDQLIADQVEHGKGAMPAFSLSDDEIKAIIGFMTQAFKKSS
jgi:mono/diheme cytochrome c family protein